MALRDFFLKPQEQRHQPDRLAVWGQRAHPARVLIGSSGGAVLFFGTRLGPPARCPFSISLGEGSPTQIDYRKKGTLILTSLLENLEVGHFFELVSLFLWVFEGNPRDKTVFRGFV